MFSASTTDYYNDGPPVLRTVARVKQDAEKAADDGLARVEGHAEGARAVRDAVETAARIGVEYLTLYAFSVANWARPRGEVIRQRLSMASSIGWPKSWVVATSRCPPPHEPRS